MTSILRYFSSYLFLPSAILFHLFTFRIKSQNDRSRRNPKNLVLLSHCCLTLQLRIHFAPSPQTPISTQQKCAVVKGKK